MGVWMFWTRLGLYVVSDSVAVLESALFALHCHGVSVSFPIICYVTDAHNYARANTLWCRKQLTSFCMEINRQCGKQNSEGKTPTALSQAISPMAVLSLFHCFEHLILIP